MSTGSTMSLVTVATSLPAPRAIAHELDGGQAEGQEGDARRQKAGVDAQGAALPGEPDDVIARAAGDDQGTPHQDRAGHRGRGLVGDARQGHVVVGRGPPGSWIW